MRAQLEELFATAATGNGERERDVVIRPLSWQPWAQLEELFAAAAAGHGERDRGVVLRPKMLSVWQPWAWLIIHGPKRVENRTWAPGYEGPLLIHAAKRSGMSRKQLDEYATAQLDELEAAGLICEVPELDELDAQRGHVIGRVEVTGCRRIAEGDDDGFAIPGKLGWTLEDPRPITPYERRGQQGLVDGDAWVLATPRATLQEALTAFHQGGMSKLEAPLIACGERMVFGELIARVAEGHGSKDAAATIRRRLRRA